jgi:sugar phosphate permease
MPIRKWVWVTGGLLSAVAMALVLLAVDSVQGVAAGWLIIALLSLYSLARGICSVSAKDVLGKTISKSRRGSLMGMSASISGGFILLIGLAVQFGGLSNGDQFLFKVLLAGSVFAYLASIVFFALINEVPGATGGGANAINEALGSLTLVITDKPFRQFMIARTLLLSIALAPPFYVLLAQQKGLDLAGMGLLIVASGVASMVSGPIWGRMSDRSSRQVMTLASLLAGFMGLLIFSVEAFSNYSLNQLWHITLLFFLIAVFHGGARLGRKTYLVDMADSDNRSTYVAVSNTLIGVFMLAGGAIGVIADIFSVAALIGLLGLISVLSAFYIGNIKDVSEA